MRIGVVLVIGLVSAVARGDVRKDLIGELESLPADRGGASRPPRFAFSNNDVHVAPKKLSDARPSIGGIGVWSDKVVVAESADKKSAWIAADLGEVEIGCGMAPCPPPPPRPPATHHATALAEKVGADWQWVAWHIAPVVDGKQQATALKEGIRPDAIARSVTGAEDVVKQFESTIGDPKRLLASISERKDVVLYGSERPERTVGGAAVRAKLASWKLTFTVRGGVAAGLTASRTVAYVAANVDAESQARPKNKLMPYRLLLIYEKTGSSWQIVAAHFSVVT